MRKEVETTVPMEIMTAPTPSREENMSIVVSSTRPTTPPWTDEIPESASMLEDDEEQVDFENTPTRGSMDINMVYYLPTEFRVVDEEGEVAVGLWS